jgi:hypothetical protein
VSAAISIRSAITGTATIPLITATQTNACIALTEAAFAAAPSSVATAIPAGACDEHAPLSLPRYLSGRR